MPDFETWSSRVLAAVRIMAALPFFEHGLMNPLAFPAAISDLPSPRPGILPVAAIIEIVGGALNAIGSFTRTAALICSRETAASYFTFHAPRNLWPSINQSGAAILSCFVSLHLAFAGAGSSDVNVYLSTSRQGLSRA